MANAARAHSSDIERFVYATSRWDARLYDTRRTEDGILDEAEREIRNEIYSGRESAGYRGDFDRSESESQTLGREVFARLYSDVPRLDEPNGPGWATKAHDLLDQIDGFQTLHDEIAGDPDLAALATGSLLRSVATQLGDLVEEDSNQNPGDEGENESGFGAPTAGEKMRSALRRAIKTARREVGEVREGLAGFAPGFGEPPAAHDMDSDKRMKLAEWLRTDERLADLIRRAGRIERIARCSKKKSPTEGTSEVYDVTRGADIPRLLPSEISKLAHPALRALLLRDLAQRSALQYALRSNEPLGRGPIISLLDVSGSMRGQPHDWTRAIGVAMASTAQRQKRSATIADFNGRVCRTRWIGKLGTASIDGEEVSPIDAILDIATAGVSGGTNFDRALRWSLDRIVEAGTQDESRADLVIVTDGCDTVSAEVAEQIATLRETTGLRLFACTINGGAIDSNLAKVADEVLDLDSASDPGESFATAGWAR